MLKCSEELLGQTQWSYLRCQSSLFHFTPAVHVFNYYDVLQVPRNADSKTIKDSYLKLCKQYHPDSSDGLNISKENKVKRFQEINEAYSCLSKPETKLEYDRSINPYVHSSPASGYGSSYANPYRSARARKYPQRPDGYRPYDEAFKNKQYYYRDDPFEDLKTRYGNRNFREFNNFKDFQNWQAENQKIDPTELRLMKFAVYVFLSMAIYIIAVRILVLRSHLKGRKQEGDEEWRDRERMTKDRFSRIYFDRDGRLHAERREMDPRRRARDFYRETSQNEDDK